MSDPLSLLTEGLFSTTGLTVTTQGLLQASSQARTSIRDRVVQKLKAETDAGDRIFGSRILPLPEDHLPAILVYTQNEPTVAIFAESPRIYDRTLQLVVEIIVARGELLDDQVNAIARIVETVILPDRFQGGLARDTQLSSLAIVFPDADQADQKMARCQIVFDVIYQTDAVELVGDDLKNAEVGWDLAAPDGQKEAEDTLIYP